MSKQGHGGEKKKNQLSFEVLKAGPGVLDGERKQAIPGLSILQTSVWNVTFALQRHGTDPTRHPGINSCLSTSTV